MTPLTSTKAVPVALCSHPGCTKSRSPSKIAASKFTGLCSMHERRKREGIPMDAPRNVRPPSKWSLLTLAAIRYADADGDSEFDAARKALHVAAREYVEAGTHYTQEGRKRDRRQHKVAL